MLFLPVALNRISFVQQEKSQLIDQSSILSFTGSLVKKLFLEEKERTINLNENISNDLINDISNKLLDLQDSTNKIISKLKNSLSFDQDFKDLNALYKENNDKINKLYNNNEGNVFLQSSINNVASTKEAVAEITSLTKEIYANNKMESKSRASLTNESIKQKCQELIKLKEEILNLKIL